MYPNTWIPVDDVIDSGLIIALCVELVHHNTISARVAEGILVGLFNGNFHTLTSCAALALAHSYPLAVLVNTCPAVPHADGSNGLVFVITCPEMLIPLPAEYSVPHPQPHPQLSFAQAYPVLVFFKTCPVVPVFSGSNHPVSLAHL